MTTDVPRQPREVRWPVLITVTVPPLVLAALGITHPMDLTPDSAPYWRDLHIALLPLFPLLGLAPWLVSRGGPVVLRWATALLGYAYAAFYSALDILVGVGGGEVKASTGHEASRQALFDLGNALAGIGVYSYLTGTVLAAAFAVVRARLRAVPGAVLVIAGALSFLDSHIYWPRGVATMVVLAVGWAALVWAGSRGASSARASSGPGAFST